MTASCSPPPSMPCRRSAMGVDVPGADLTSCTLTRLMTIVAAGPNAASAPLCPGSPAVVWTSMSDWDATAGWWSAHWRGSIASAVSPSAMNDARTSIWPSPHSDARSSASTNANGFVRSSNVTVSPKADCEMQSGEAQRVTFARAQEPFSISIVMVRPVTQMMHRPVRLVPPYGRPRLQEHLPHARTRSIC
jgi:hypothetical protein